MIFNQFLCFLCLCKKIKKCYTLNLLTIKKISFSHRLNDKPIIKPTHHLSFYLVVKKLTTLALKSFLLVLLRDNAKSPCTSCSIQGAEGVHVQTLRDGNPFYFLIQNYHISVSIWKSAKCGHCTSAEQECCVMTDQKQQKTPKAQTQPKH